MKIAGITRLPESVGVQWQGGKGPYLVESSGDLLHWSSQGDPVEGTGHTLVNYRQGAFFRVLDLDPAAQHGAFFGLIQSEQGEFGNLLARHRLKSRWWLYKPRGTLATVPAASSASSLCIASSSKTGWSGR